MKYKIFAINFGSTSTKIAIFENDHLLFEKTLRHNYEHLQSFENSIAQKDYRVKALLTFLKQNKINLNEIDVFVGRGGLIKPIEGGTYIVNELMLKDLRTMKYGDHVSNLGAIVAYELAQQVNKKAFTVDPVVIDELSEIARISGFKGIERKSAFHALNQRAVAKRYAKEVNKTYEQLNLIIAHIGGGISIGFHNKGKVVDVNNALGGDGPFSPQRAGALPIFDLIDYVYHSDESIEKIKKKLVTEGGLYSYLNTASGIEICQRINQGDKEAYLYAKAMTYQINKHVGGLYYTAKGDIDAVIYTGGLIYQKGLINMLKEFSPPQVKTVFYPGEDEMHALATGVLRVLQKTEEVKEYK